METLKVSSKYIKNTCQAVYNIESLATFQHERINNIVGLSRNFTILPTVFFCPNNTAIHSSPDAFKGYIAYCKKTEQFYFFGAINNGLRIDGTFKNTQELVTWCASCK